VARNALEILEHHLKALAALDIDEIMSDYTDESVLLTPDGAIRGASDVRDFFADVVKTRPDLVGAIAISRQETVGDIAYIVWSAPGFLALGTDTFLVRDGKIAVQTFAAQPA
jgi:ketosteroid isomerase-like protein